MQASVYAADARLQENHWWYAGRRQLFGEILRGLNLAPSVPVLEVGTSAGTNLKMLRELGFRDVTGLDFSDDAIRLCAENGLGEVRKGDITAMPFPRPRSPWSSPPISSSTSRTTRAPSPRLRAC